MLQNLVHHLGAPASPGAVMQAVYDHPEFPFLSLYHLTQLLGAWSLRAGACRIAPESLPLIPMPTLACVEKPFQAAWKSPPAWPWTRGCTGCCKSTPTNCFTCRAGR